jgi:hypothetical protein
MKKLLLILLCVPLFGLGQNRYHEDDLTTPNDKTYLKQDMSLVNGIVYCEFGDLGMWVNGKKDGFHKNWYQEGQLKYKKNFKDGKEDGVQKFWFRSGRLWSEKNYKYGKPHGLHKMWLADGQLIDEANYKDGNAHGLVKEYYSNGQIRYEANYVEGKPIFEKRWDEYGNEEE